MENASRAFLDAVRKSMRQPSGLSSPSFESWVARARCFSGCATARAHVCSRSAWSPGFQAGPFQLFNVIRKLSLAAERATLQI
jgi:hypothetical protein